MVKRRSVAFVALTALVACSPELTAPDDLVITCESDASCPDNFKCDVASNRCFDTRVSHPRLFLDTVTRGLADIGVSVTIADSDGDPASITAEYDVGDGFEAATIDPGPFPTSRDGVRHVITWHAGDDLGETRYRDGVRLRLTASDTSGGGTVTTTEPFAIGDDAPEVTDVTISGNGAVSGNIIVSYIVRDSAADAAAIEKLEVSYDGTFTDTVIAFEAGASVASVIPSGAVSNIETSVEGTRQAFTWASTASVVDAPNARLRITLRDAYLASAPADSQAFYLRNQFPPRVTTVRSPAATTRRATGPTPFSYRLVDENSEPANVLFEYSVNGGVSFMRCREYRVAESEGLFGLATAPEVAGGIEHVFVWDPTGANVRNVNDVLVRARADTPTDAGVIYAFGRGAGAPLISPYDTGSLASSGDLNDAGGPSGFGDINDDGLVDWVLTQDNLDLVRYGALPYPSFVGVANGTPAATGTITAITLADFNGDGGADVALAYDQAQRLRLTTRPSGGAPALDDALVDTPAWPSAPVALHGADFDGDGHVDLAARFANGIAVAFGDGAGGLAAPTTFAATDIRASVIASINGDASADLVLLRDSGTSLTTLVATNDRAAPFLQRDTALTTAFDFVASGDFDCDGLDDVMLAVHDAFDGQQYLTTSSGDLRGPALTPLANNPIQSIAAGDVDGDCLADIAFAGSAFANSTRNVAFNLGTSSGIASFGPGVVWGAAAPPATELHVIAGTDGRVTLAATSPPGEIKVAVAHLSRVSAMGDGALQTPLAAYWNNSALYIAYAIADVDADGIEDHLALGTGEIHVWRGIGVRGLAAGIVRGPTIIPCDGCTDMLAGDANNDAFADIWVASPDGNFLRIGSSAGFAAPAPTATAPTGFTSLARAPFPDLSSADFNGDGIYDRVYFEGSTLQLWPGLYDSGGPTIDGPSSFNGAFVNYPIELAAQQAVFIGDLNDDGLADLVFSQLRNAASFGFFFGMNENSLPRHTTVAPYGSVPNGLPRVSSMAADLVGEDLTFHVARIATDDVAKRNDELRTLGLIDTNDVEMTAPYEVRGDVRITAATGLTANVAGRTPLHVEARLGARIGTGTDYSRAGLSSAAGSNRGLIVDIPLIEHASFTQAQAAAAATKVMQRLTDYDRLETGIPRRASRWVRIPAVSDLAQGTGPRYVSATAANGKPIIRVLIDRGGVIQAFTH